MNPITIIAILELVNKAIKIGGEIVPVALRAYAAIKNETGMTDDELVAQAKDLNQKDREKLLALIAETE